MKISSDIAAIVTGGASGLGRGVASSLAAEGVSVTILDVNPEGKEVAETIDGIFHAVDVTDPNAVASALKSARNSHGQERICINCAGIAPAQKTVSRGAAHDPQVFAKVIGINLIGSFNVASQSAAGMTALDPIDNATSNDGERGVIINTASIASYDGQIGQTAYAASKGGIASMTLPMARDLADKGVRVMAIAPGIFSTPMLMAFPKDVQDALAAQIPFPSRLGQAKEFAALALHIIDNPMLNGEVIRLDGAIRMPPK
jgi:NAD(P)-dependent dehydrogenase (short-subunit alcohol dehydrogenase family)